MKGFSMGLGAQIRRPHGELRQTWDIWNNEKNLEVL